MRDENKDIAEVMVSMMFHRKEFREMLSDEYGDAYSDDDEGFRQWALDMTEYQPFNPSLDPHDVIIHNSEK